MEKPEPKIDHTSIKYPTDGITIGQIRGEMPQILDSTANQPPNFRRTEVGLLIWLERLLAENTFRKAFGLSVDERRSGDRREMLSMIGREYVRYGLAIGGNQAAEMFRDIERQALEQAKAQGAMVKNR